MKVRSVLPALVLVGSAGLLGAYAASFPDTAGACAAPIMGLLPGTAATRVPIRANGTELATALSGCTSAVTVRVVHSILG